MYFDRGSVAHSSAREPNSKRVARMSAPNTYKVSPADVGGRRRASIRADVSSTMRESCGCGNTARK